MIHRVQTITLNLLVRVDRPHGQRCGISGCAQRRRYRRGVGDQAPDRIDFTGP